MLGSILRFLVWWREELLSFVPAKLRRVFQARQDSVVVELREGQIHLKQVHGSRVEELGAFAWKDESTDALRQAVQGILGKRSGNALAIGANLPAEQFLTRPLTFPAMVEGNLRQVVQYEMERRTPFKPEEVYYDVEVVDRTSDGDQIDVALHVVPRNVVDSAIEWLTALGLRPDRVGGATETLSVARGINVLPSDSTRDSSHRSRVVTTGLGLVTACLLIVAVYLPLEQKRTMSARLTDQVATLRKEATATERLNAEIDQLAKRNQFVLKRKISNPPAIAVLDDLTKLLPDDTWLFQLRLKAGEISIQGYTSAASALVELIENSPSFHNVTMQSRVTRDQRTGLERFRIRFDLAAEGG